MSASIRRLTAADVGHTPAYLRVHQFNDNAQRLTRTLTDALDLQRIGLHLVRLEGGRDSTQFHYHDTDEEFVYILAGRGIAQLGEQSIEVHAGDFMGFPAPSCGHSLHNPDAEDLVYLMGGERNPADVVHYPRIRRTMIKSHGRRSWVDWDNLHDLPG
ncbi:MAG: cupin domain-containing protein [Pseudomonadales bacterium]